jgi:galactose mutarotase-like enzyme
MAIYTIQNDVLKVQISDKGAELQSIFNTSTELEYLWKGDATFWAKKSPILFPIVGSLKNNTYYFQQKSYQLNRHGFARDMLFESEELDETSIRFILRSSAETLSVYPFPFELIVHYTLKNNALSVVFTVKNTGTTEMYFSLGAHPAFAVPLTKNTDYEQYSLIFNHYENAGIWPLTADGLIQTQPVPFFNNNNKIDLKKSLFYGDALVFKHLQSSIIQLRNNQNEHGLTFTHQHFPYLGIWAAKDADFVCIEPWCGIADSETTTQQLLEKEGIEQLAAGGVFERSWLVSVY